MTAERKYWRDNGYDIVTRYADAIAVYCPTCDHIWSRDENPYWGLNKVKGLHEKGSGHKTYYIGAQHGKEGG